MNTMDSMQALLRLSSVGFRYGREEVLRQVSLTVRPGRIIGVIGDNGLGKSTLLKLMAGLLTPSAGTIESGSSTISYALSPEQLPAWMRTRDLLFYYRNFFPDFDEGRAGELLLLHRIPEKKSVRRLSRGQAALLCLILALSRRAQLYLMDEPLQGIDPNFKKDIKRFLLEHMPENSSLVMSTHLLRELEFLLDEIIIVTRSQVSCRDTEAIRQTLHMSVEQYYLKEVPHE